MGGGILSEVCLDMANVVLLAMNVMKVSRDCNAKVPIAIRNTHILMNFFMEKLHSIIILSRTVQVESLNTSGYLLLLNFAMETFLAAYVY